jgi:tetratricopeptide (TPR) repeat protein
MAKMILRAGRVAIKIILPLVILGLIFYSVKKLTPAKANENPPAGQEVSLLIEQADAIYQDIKTGKYSKKGRYDQAAQAAKIYQTIVTDYPGTENAFEAQAKLVNLDIVSGRWPQAQEAYQKLLTDFAGNENMPRAVRDIAYRYHIFKKYNEAIELYQYIIDTWPDSFYAMWSQMAVEVSKSGLGNDETAEANINKVLTDFAADERLPEAVRDVAYQYHMLEKYDKSVELYQYITDTWPDSFYAMWSQMGAAMSNIALGDDTAVEANIDKLLGDFADGEYDSDVAKAVRDIAYQYHKFNKYTKAKQLYQKVIDTWPQSEYAMWSHMGAAASNVALGDDTAVQSNIDRLLADFAGDERLPEAFRDIAYQYHMLEKYDKAVELYQYITDTWPGSFYAMWSQMGAAMSNVALGDEEALQSNIDKLLGFAGGEHDSHIAQAVRDVAYQCHKFGKYEKAKQLYQYILDNYPNSEHVRWAKTDLIKANIALDDEPNINEAINELIAEYSDNPDLPEVLCIIGEEYCVKASELKNQGLETKAREYFRKAISVWERVMNEFPDSDAVPRAYYCSGGCYELELSEYEKAIEYYQKVLDNWPYFDYQRASYAQFGITRCYENLEKSVRISPEEATVGIIQACNNLLANYPETNPVILQASRKLLNKYQVSE